MGAEQQLTVMAQFRARRGAEDAVKAALARVVVPTRGEAGNISYDLYQATDDPTLFVLYERWRDQDSFDWHLEQPYLQQMLADVSGHLAEPYSGTQLTPVEASTSP